MANLRTTIDKLTKELNAKIIYRNLDCKGKAIVPLKIVIVNKNISEFEQLQVILHELEHIKKEHSETSLSSPHYLQKMEAEAEHGRVKADISWYIEETPKEYWNMFNLIDYFEFNSEFENYIEEEFKKIDKD